MPACAGPFPNLANLSDSPDFPDVAAPGVAREQITANLGTYRQIFETSSASTGRRRDGSLRLSRADRALRRRSRRGDPGCGHWRRLRHPDILALNVRSEIALSAQLVLDGCTAFAAFGRATRGATTVLCQNWDWRPALRESMVVLLLSQPGKPSLTLLTEAGIIGKLGFNSAGLGVCLNAIVTDRLEPSGTPLHVVLRAILDSRTLGDAVTAVARANIACSANFLLAQHGNGAIDIEAVPGDVDILLPDAEHDVLAHTNHLQSLRLTGVRDLGKLAFGDSYPRLAQMRRLLHERYGELDAAAGREILRDHGNAPDSICRHVDEIGDPVGKRLHSVLALVMDLERQTLEVTDGPPCSGEFFNPVALAGAGGDGMRRPVSTSRPVSGHGD